jgi:hypothetical protein
LRGICLHHARDGGVAAPALSRQMGRHQSHEGRLAETRKQMAASVPRLLRGKRDLLPAGSLRLKHHQFFVEAVPQEIDAWTDCQQSVGVNRIETEWE